MPAVIAAGAGFFAGEILVGVVGGVLGASAIAGVAGTVIAGAGSLIVGSAVTRALTPAPKPQASQQFEQVARGILLNSGGSIEPIPVIYGSRRVGGIPVTPWMAYGATNEYISRVFVLCEGEISAINTVYFDDTASSDARFSGLVTLEKYVGTDSQTASAALIANFPGVWTAAHRLRGLAYLVVTLKWSDSAWSGAPVVTADVDGKLLEDPRAGSPTLVSFSHNSALAIRDYLTNTRYGRGYPASAIDDTSFSAAADYCDGLVTVPAAGSPSTAQQARYTCDGLVNVDAALLDNVGALLTSCRGALNRSGGTLKLLIDKPETVSSTFAFTEDNIVGAWQIRKPGKDDKTNRVRAQFFDPDTSWQPNFAPFDSPAFRTQDNEKLLDRQISLPFTADFYRAQQMAQIECKQSREGLTCKFTATVAATRCEIYDVVPITHSSPAWTAKPFRILNLRLLANDEVEVLAREYQATVYDLDNLDLRDSIPDTNLPSPFGDLTLTGLTASSGTADLFRQGDGTIVPRVRLRWTQPSNPFIKEYEIQVDRGSVSPTEWADCPKVLAPAAEGFALPVNDGEAVNLRIRARTSYGNAGDWAYVYGHTVVGKTAAPSDVTGAVAFQNGDVIVFGCDTVEDADLDLIEVRWLDYGDTNWDNGIPMANILRGQQLPSASIPQGTWTFLYKSKDTSGNYSANATRVDLVVTADGYTLIASREDAPGWPGTLDGFIVSVSGALVPLSTKAANLHTKTELFEQYVPYPVATSTYTAPEIDKTIDASARVYANIVSTLGRGVSSGTSDPVHQVDMKLAAGAYDGYEAWSVGTANFRYLKSRISSPGLRIRITGFETTIDARTRTEDGTYTTPAGGSVAVSFTNPFHATPGLVVSPQGSGDVSASHTDASGTGFTGYFKTAGAAGAGTASYKATGA